MSDLSPRPTTGAADAALEREASSQHQSQLLDCWSACLSSPRVSSATARLSHHQSDSDKEWGR